MNIRMIAGLGMLLIAAGLMFIWYLGQRSPTDFSPTPTPVELPAAETRVPGPTATAGPAAVDSFLATYGQRFRGARQAAQAAAWDAALSPTEEFARRWMLAERSLGDFTGSREVIGPLRGLRGRADLSDLQDRQLEVAWRLAARRPGSLPEVAARLVATDAALHQARSDHVPPAPWPDEDDRSLTAAALDSLLGSTADPHRRRTLWETGQTLGPLLKSDLTRLRDLRNEAARSMGYSSWFGLQAASHGLTGGELGQLLKQLLDEVMPLYRQLHCWARHTLAARYGTPPPPRIPIHWLDDRTGARWPGLVPATASSQTTLQPDWLVARAREFWTSLGFAPLPATVIVETDIPPPGGPSGVWPVDLGGDVRVLLRLPGDRTGLRTAHGQLGLAHAHLATDRPGIPLLLRGPADGAFGAGIVALGRLAADQPPYLSRLGWPEADLAPDEVRRLLREALTGPVVTIPFLAGTLSAWEYDLYENDLEPHRLNSHWWDLAGTWQGLAPPSLRGEDWCDPAVVPAVVEAPAQAWQEALGQVIAHQLHRYLCRRVLDQDPRMADYAGSRAAGIFLHDLMALGRTRDGLVILRQATGEELSAAALLEYYAPLMTWLEQKNAGRDVDF